MKKSIAIISTLFIVCIISSCGDTKNNKLIIGNWRATEWLVNGQPSDNDPKATKFSFTDKGQYTFDYAGAVEKGTYKVENDMLFTTAEKQQEIMVNITKLTADSLVFDMNRGGQPETLILLKKK